MDSRKRAQRVIQLLADNEEAVARLYQACAEKFPRHRRFWLELADEEVYHSHLIQSIGHSRDITFINDERFDARLFTAWSRSLEDKLARVSGEKMSFKDALVMALEVETTMLEKGYFEVFEGESQQFKRTMYALAVGTEAHTSKIRSKLFGRFWRFFRKKSSF